MTRIAITDTETTGLSLDDEIWDFAAIVREPNGGQATCQMFIEHDSARCARLPEPFLADHRARFPTDCTADAPYPHPDVYSRETAATVIAGLLTDNIHIVGCVPNFDTERLALLLRRYGYEPGWHYHLIDVENLAVGYLNGLWMADATGTEQLPPAPPWDSEALSRAVGVAPDRFERHTALGDVKWAMAIFDVVTGETR